MASLVSTALDRTLTRKCASTGRTYGVTEVPMEEWPALLDRFPEHTIFHTRPWLEALTTVHKAGVRLLSAASKGGPAAIWPVLTTRKGPLRVHGSPCPGWTTAYLGPIFSPDCDIDAALNALLGHSVFRKCSYFFCKVLNSARHVDLRRFQFEEVQQFETYCIDLTLPTETLWSNLKSECRTQIRKARKLGLEVRLEEDDSFLPDFWQMAQDTFSVCGIKPPFTRPFMEALWHNLHAAGSVKALSAWMNGERIALLFLPFDGHTMYYWSGGSHLRHRSVPAHNLLHWEAIELGQRLGLGRYDFIGVEGNGGRFKRTFGPQAVQIATQWERVSSPVIRALKDLYQRHLMRRQLLGCVWAAPSVPILAPTI